MYYNPVRAIVLGGSCESISQSSLSSVSPERRDHISCSRRRNLRVARQIMATKSSTNTSTKHFLRHVESMKELPSGAGQISELNAVVLGEALATEENEFVFPSDEFSSQALVQSPEQVLVCFH